MIGTAADRCERHPICRENVNINIHLNHGRLYSIQYDSYDSYYDSYDGTSTHVHTYHREEELHMFNEMHDGYYTFQRC